MQVREGAYVERFHKGRLAFFFLEQAFAPIGKLVFGFFE